MITVTLYTRKDCPLCEQVKAELASLQSQIPHQVNEVDIATRPDLEKSYGNHLPVIQAGPYFLRSPFNQQELFITLGAVQRGQEQNRAIDDKIASGQYPETRTWTASDRFSYWLSHRYIALIMALVTLYLGLPFLAPVLMKAGAAQPAYAIYKAYGLVCHQLAFRSWFLFGEQPAYPLAAASVSNLISFEKATGINGIDLFSARNFIGNSQTGYKVAFCERDVAIYGGILLFGLLYGITGRRIKNLHWILWLLIGILPIALDGTSQLISQPPLSIIAFRESTPFLRTLTGGLFGFTSAWFGFPLVEESMADTRRYLEAKIARIKAFNSSRGSQPADRSNP